MCIRDRVGALRHCLQIECTDGFVTESQITDVNRSVDGWRVRSAGALELSLIHILFTKLFAISEGLLPPDPSLDKISRYVTLEVGLAVGAALTLLGLSASVYAVSVWGAQHFGMLNYSRTMRLVIPAALLLTLGTQTIFASFFLSVLGMRRK